jgi:hypothetical protein
MKAGQEEIKACQDKADDKAKTTKNNYKKT